MSKYIFIVYLVVACSSCSKYLDSKPDKKMIILSTPFEAQALLDDVVSMNGGYPSSGEIASGDFYLNPVDWSAANTVQERNAYIWHDDVYNENPRNDWSLSYQKVYFANIVIEGIKNQSIKGGTAEQRNNILGQALFFRSYTFFHLLQLFSPVWDANNPAEGWGIALRLTPDFNAPTTRSSVKQCYEQVIADISEAVALLPESVPVKTRPSKVAGLAFLARIYLSMADYSNALKFAEQALTYKATLMDYNSQNQSLVFPFALFNDEVILHTYSGTPAIFYQPKFKVDTVLLNSYETNDLRFPLFFTKNADTSYSFKGSYTGSASIFSGLAVNELVLIKAECLARSKKYNTALLALNTLLEKRWKAGTFEPIMIDDAVVLPKILKERRKELLFRGLRWTDLRRLNQEAEHAITLTRKLDNTIHTLEPGSKRYVFKIPEDVIAITGIQQNQ